MSTTIEGSRATQSRLPEERFRPEPGAPTDLETLSDDTQEESIDISTLHLISLQPDKPRVLIVDDDPVARMTLGGLLENEWYQIITAESAEEALGRMHLIQPDVILCDLVMKGTDGDQFCRWLKLHGSWRYIPVIAVTRIDNTVAIAAMLEAGADDVVIKPVKARELQARVAAALRTRDRYLDLARRAHPHSRGNGNTVKTNGTTDTNSRQAY